MPDLDKAWNKVRDKLPEFVNTARKYNATDVVPVSQAMLLKDLASGSSGICYGLSMAYIIGRAKGESAAAVIGHGYQAAALARSGPSSSPDDEEIAYNTRIGQWSGKVRLIYQSYGHSQYQTEDEMDGAGLRTTGWDVEYSDILHRFRKVAQALVGIGNGYALINSPNHSMAAAIGGGSFSFYDPNFGSVTFATAQQFQGFFEAWFDRGFIQKGYKGLKGGKKDAPPAWSLVLKLRTFVPK